MRATGACWRVSRDGREDAAPAADSWLLTAGCWPILRHTHGLACRGNGLCMYCTVLYMQPISCALVAPCVRRSLCACERGERVRAGCTRELGWPARAPTPSLAVPAAVSRGARADGSEEERPAFWEGGGGRSGTAELAYCPRRGLEHVTVPVRMRWRGVWCRELGWRLTVGGSPMEGRRGHCRAGGGGKRGLVPVIAGLVSEDHESVLRLRAEEQRRGSGGS
ncbi:hypothetical protein BD413DRAFT_147128 [Trametes elegans]|nr:hypothetical protein BD413DRAFT_147128 [Trametes elegans]